MATQTKTVIDLSDGSVTEVALTADDLAAQKDLALFEATALADKKEDDLARVALLKRLGITADEAKLLLS